MTQIKTANKQFLKRQDSTALPEAVISQQHALTTMKTDGSLAEGGAPFPLLSPGEDTPGGMCPVLDSPVQEGY